MRRATFGALIVLASLPLAVLLSAHGPSSASCPPPSVPLGGQCVLDKDVTLTGTMVLPSGTKLNCRGHRLTPSILGVLDDPQTTANEFGASGPELAMFVHDAYDVKIQNCDISGFDFGIIVAQSKSDGAPKGKTGTKILGNTIDVRTNAIEITKSDGVLVADNLITYASERGRGIVVDYDSDDNEIKGNTITSTDAASTGLVRQAPGGAPATNTAAMDNEIHFLQSDRGVENLIVNGVLYQIPADDEQGDFEDAGRPDHNRVEENDIRDLGAGNSCTLDPGTPCQSDGACVGKGVCLLKQNSGVGFNARSSETLVIGNAISGHMDRGISFGGIANPTTIANYTAGTCSADTQRLCVTNADCNIPGYDTSGVGTCGGAKDRTFNGNTMGLAAANNMLSGVFDAAALFANNTDAFTFHGNAIDGGASGIRINPTGINGVIERNIVAHVANALYLAFQPVFTQTIRLNDFMSYAVAIRTSNNFTVSTDISANTGNYWGLSCPGFDPSLVKFDNGAVNLFVVDGQPYGVPVATTPDASLPPRCQ